MRAPLLILLLLATLPFSSSALAAEIAVPLAAAPITKAPVDTAAEKKAGCKPLACCNCYAGSPTDAGGDIWRPSYGATLLLAAAACGVYWLLMVVARWHRVARPTREMLRAQLWCLLKELETLGPPAADLAKIKGILEAGLRLINADPADPNRWSDLDAADILFWSRGQEITGWGYVHEAEVQTVPFLPDDAVWVKLKAAQSTLKVAADPESVALGDLIETALCGTPGAGRSRLDALLAQALTRNYEREDTAFWNMVTWQNKTSWLVVLGLLFIVILSALLPCQSIFFLVGGLGGLVSRLSRSLDRKDVPTDYGASWTTLFLSPVAGSLGAWSGLLITALAVQVKVMGGIFDNRWDLPFDAITLGIALLFGFSERLLDGILDKLTDATTKDNAGASAAPAAGSKVPPADAAPSSFTTLPAAVVGQPYLHPLTGRGIDPTARWSLKGGALPPGLALNVDGSFAGTTSVEATGKTFQFTVLAMNSSTSLTLSFSIPVQASA